jgi:predicted Zn-dependent protease
MRRGSWKIRIFIGLAIVAFAFIQKWSNTETNPYTGRSQHITMTSDQEIAIGLQSAPEMAQQHGGLYPDERIQSFVDAVGHKLVNSSIARDTPYKYDFHLLADDQTINAFALPGGQCFITYALFSKLNEAQLAGVLGHEIGHVIGRHSAERIADSQTWQTATMGATVGAGDLGSIVGGIGQNTLLKNGRGDELESDELGVLFMIQSGYDPYEMIKVMEILKTAGGPNRTPEFQSTHPDPENRIEKIKEAIAKYGNQS